MPWLFGSGLGTKQQRTPKVYDVPLIPWLPDMPVATNLFLMGSLGSMAYLLVRAHLLRECQAGEEIAEWRSYSTERKAGSGYFYAELEAGSQRRSRGVCGRGALPNTPFMWKLLTGAKNMHDRHVVHRDIKPGNILVGETGELVKICDLGLAISMSDPPPYTHAGTAYYMAPEMILGKPDYDTLVDTWSLGCVMAELLTGKTMFVSDDEDDDDDEINNDINQLWSIFRVLGMPDERTWPEFTSLPLTAKALQLLPAGHKHNRLRDLFPEEKLSEEGFQVLQGLLTCK